MSRLRDERGRFVRQLELELPSDFVAEVNSPSPTSSSSNKMSQHEDNPVRTLKDYLHPTRTATPSCIMFPPNAPQVDFKPGMIQLLPTFHGLESENPYVHIREFEEVVATFHSQPNAIDAVRLKFFPFSLKDKAKSWLYSLRPRSIGTWAEMTQAFFNKYFPHHKTNNLKRQISTFSQKDSETLYQAWERFKELLSLCPHHGFESWRIVSYFYEGLTPRERQFIEMMCNGEFLHKDPDEAIDYLNELAEKAHTWTGPSAIDSTNRSKSTGIYYLREEDSLKAQVEALTRELEALKTRDSKPVHTAARVESYVACFVCGGVDHLAQDCPTYSEIRGVYEEQCNTLGTFRKPFSPYSETYNPGWRNHPNFSWKPESSQPTSSNNWKTDAPPQRPYQPHHSQPTRNSLEDTLHAFIEAQSKTNQRLDSLITQVVEEHKEIKNQISKLTSALTVTERGKFPSQPQPNPSGQQTSNPTRQDLREVNAITTLNGTFIDENPRNRIAHESSSTKNMAYTKDSDMVVNFARIPFIPVHKTTIDFKEKTKSLTTFVKLEGYGESSWQPEYEEFSTRSTHSQSSIVETPKLKIKSLLKKLNHVSLGSGDKFLGNGQRLKILDWLFCSF